MALCEIVAHGMRRLSVATRVGIVLERWVGQSRSFLGCIFASPRSYNSSPVNLDFCFMYGNECRISP